MEQTVNPEAIRGFLRDYRSRAYAHDHGHGYSQTSYLPGYTSSSTPRWAQPVTGNEVLRLDDYTEYEDDEDDRRSEYTTAPTVVSRRSSRTSTTRSSAAPSSIFSRASRRSRGAPSSVGQSTAPSVGVPHQTFLQQFPQPPTTTTQTAGSDHLWCEFSALLSCPATFRLDDEARWIDHHAAHLRDRFPRTLMCWFCDHVPFVAATSSFSSSSINRNNNAAAAANFDLRMRHIRSHIFDDPRLTSEDTRPDFHVVQHLWEEGLLEEGAYRHAMAYDETPVNYRLPGSGSGTGAGVGLNLERERGPLGQYPGRKEYEVHDLEKERRRRERGGKRRGR